MTAVRHCGFHHEALLHDGLDDFVDHAAPFVRDGLERGEAVLVAVTRPKASALREELGSEAAGVRFAEMERIGRNPACIIPFWRDFVDHETAGGATARGIGEPIWPERSEAELLECQLHEALLNLAFAGAPELLLVCPYDVSALAEPVVEEAMRTHPAVTGVNGHAHSDPFDHASWARAAFRAGLPEPSSAVSVLEFVASSVSRVRELATEKAVAAGVAGDRVAEVGLVAHELATNSIEHGGGRGMLRTWSDDGAFVLEVWDDGALGDPLAGRVRPGFEQERGRGLWLTNHLVDLTQIRSGAHGTVVRVHVSYP